MDCFFFW